MTTVTKPIFNETLKSRYGIKRGMGIQGIVLHDTCGNGKHGDTMYLANPGDGRKVGVDFTVERDGSIWRLTPNEVQYAMPHAGKDTFFKGARNGRVCRITIGIEMTQHKDLKLEPMWPEAQVRACAHLCAWLANQHGLLPADIVTHRQISVTPRRSDPRFFPFSGTDGFWYYFWDASGQAAEYVKSLKPDEPIVPPLNPIHFNDPKTTPLLRFDPRGDVNDEVAVLEAQHLLMAKGFDLDADGYFGPAMLKVVQTFQGLHGLDKDGKIGPKTWAKLL